MRCGVLVSAKYFMQLPGEAAGLWLSTRAAVGLPDCLVCLLQFLHVPMALLPIPALPLPRHPPSNLLTGTGYHCSAALPAQPFSPQAQEIQHFLPTPAIGASSMCNWSAQMGSGRRPGRAAECALTQLGKAETAFQKHGGGV